MRLVAENPDLLCVKFRPKQPNQRLYYPCPVSVKSRAEPPRKKEVCPLARCPGVQDLKRVRKMEKVLNSRQQLEINVLSDATREDPEQHQLDNQQQQQRLMQRIKKSQEEQDRQFRLTTRQIEIKQIELNTQRAVEQLHYEPHALTGEDLSPEQLLRKRVQNGSEAIQFMFRFERPDY